MFCFGHNEKGRTMLHAENGDSATFRFSMDHSQKTENNKGLLVVEPKHNLQLRD